MKIKGNFVMRNVAGENIVVPVNNTALEYKGVITLNETGAFLFDKLMGGISKEDLISSLLSEYDVSAEKAADDVEAFISKLVEANLIEQ